MILEKLEMRDSDTELYDQPCLHKPTAYNSYIETGCEKSLAKHMLHYNAIILSGTVVLTVAQVKYENAELYATKNFKNIILKT